MCMATPTHVQCICTMYSSQYLLSVSAGWNEHTPKQQRRTHNSVSHSKINGGTHKCMYVSTRATNKPSPSPTSCLPPEQAKERAVSFVRSDWASMSALWSSRMATVTACPALAARMRGVQPFLSRCSMSAPWARRSSTSSSWPPEGEGGRGQILGQPLFHKSLVGSNIAACNYISIALSCILFSTLRFTCTYTCTMWLATSWTISGPLAIIVSMLYAYSNSSSGLINNSVYI